MNPYNQRKEPTFGQPIEADVATTPLNATVNDHTVANLSAEVTAVNPTEQPKTEPQKMAFSLHTNNAPNYTFTPVMKRPAEQATTLSTLEEQAEQTMSNQNAPLASHNTPTRPAEKPNGGFAFAPVVEDQPMPESADVQQNEVVASQPEASLSTSEQRVNSTPPVSAIERVIPAMGAKAVVEKVPSKFRRLAIVLLLLLLVVLGIWLLKPNTPESVETLQEQGSSLPIEFRPVDEEEAKRAEAQAKALQDAQAQQSAEQSMPETAIQPQSGEQAVSSQENMAGAVGTNVTSMQSVVVEKPVVADQMAQQPAVLQVQEQAVIAVQKPKTAGSVVYQPETAKLVKVSPTIQQKSSSTLSVTPPAKAQKQPQPKVEAVKAEGKSVAVKQPAPAPVAKPVPATAVASKTMIVPKGVSLMQVFRDHNLNISDVNAMSRANGFVSNLKVGEKVTVQLDKNNRVTEMRIGSGGKFIRQANGSYLYK